jgi:hypothetical protein
MFWGWLQTHNLPASAKCRDYRPVSPHLTLSSPIKWSKSDVECLTLSKTPSTPVNMHTHTRTHTHTYKHSNAHTHSLYRHVLGKSTRLSQEGAGWIWEKSSYISGREKETIITTYCPKPFSIMEQKPAIRRVWSEGNRKKNRKEMHNVWVKGLWGHNEVFIVFGDLKHQPSVSVGSALTDSTSTDQKYF